MTERDRDEMHLAWLRMRDAGQSVNQIAARYGVSASGVSAIIGRIRRAVAESEAS